MQTAQRDDSLETELRTLLRLRLKHPSSSMEAKSYRQAIIDRVRRLKALRLARRANTDLLLPPLRKKFSPRAIRPEQTLDEQPSAS